MNNPASLATLVGLTRKRLETAGGKLRQAMDARHSAQQQLALLRDYRLDYVQRLQRAGELGMPASNYQNFNRFIATLDLAISQQNEVIARLESQSSQQREKWQHQKRQLDSFEALAARHQQQMLQLQSRAEQRSADEQTAARHHSRRQADLLAIPL